MTLLKKLGISPQRHRDFKLGLEKINFLARKVKFWLASAEKLLYKFSATVQPALVE